MKFKTTRNTFPLTRLVLHPLNPRQQPIQKHVEELRGSVRQYGVLRDPIGVLLGEEIGVIDGWHLTLAMRAEGLTEATVTLIDPATPPTQIGIVATFINASQAKLPPKDQALARMGMMRDNDWSESDLERESGGLLKQSETSQLIGALGMHPQAIALWDGKKFGKSLGYHVSRFPMEEQPELARRIVAGEINRDWLTSELSRRNAQPGRKAAKPAKVKGKTRRGIVFVLEIPRELCPEDVREEMKEPISTLVKNGHLPREVWGHLFGSN